MKEVDRTMGENNADVVIAELKAIMESVRDQLVRLVGDVGGLRKEVSELSRSVTIHDETYKDLKSRVEKAELKIEALSEKVTKHGVIVVIAAVVIGWFGNAYVNSEIRDAKNPATATATKNP